MKKTVAVLLVSAVALSAAGCSSVPQLPSLPNLPFGAKSKVSPEKLMEVCEEYDSEQYDDADEIASDLDNNRALLAGMYTYAEGKDCRTQLNNEDINELYSDVSDELFSNIYWKKITSSTMFIQVFSDEEGEIKLSAVAMEFGSSDDAEDYYGMKTEYFATLHEDDDSYECSTDEDLDGSLEYTVTTVYRGQSAECFATYIDKDCVMVLTGYEHKRNDATEYLQEICEIFGIPSPDITEWDCNSQPEIPSYVTGDVEDRFMAAVEYLHASEVDASSGMRASALDGAHYFLTQDRGSMSQFASDMGSTSGYELNELGILYDIGTGGGMTTVTMYRFADQWALLR